MLGRNPRQHGLTTAKPSVTDRRTFLRRAGISAAVTAAVVGGADLAGLSAASAATRSKRSSPEECCITCIYEPRQCNGGRACPQAGCCFYCYFNSGCGSDGYRCMNRSCTTFSQCN
jgi:hypothetical protein